MCSSTNSFLCVGESKIVLGVLGVVRLIRPGSWHGLGEVGEGASVGEPCEHARAQRRTVQVHGGRVVPLQGVAVVALHVGNRR